MAFKRIQLRGISRTPSDRMNEDGGVAESLNIQIDQQESSPVLAPKPKNIGLPEGFVGDVLFMHTTKRYTNFIVREDKYVYALGQDPFITDATEDIKVTALGNILVCIYNGKCVYVMNVDGKYKLLGGNIPFPELNFRLNVRSLAGESQTVNAQASFDAVNDAVYGPYLTDSRDWAYMSESVLSTDPRSEWYSSQREGVSKLWMYFDEALAHSEAYARPVLAKYTLLMYDGTEIDSDPILLSGSATMEQASGTVVTRTVKEGIGHIEDMYAAMTLYAGNGFDINVERDERALDVLKDLRDNWSEIIKGVRVYLSQDITPERVKNFSGCRIENIEEHYATEVITHDEFTDPSDRQTTYWLNRARLVIEEADKMSDLNDYAVFNLVNEYTLDEIIEENQQLDWYNNTDRALKHTLRLDTVQAKHNYIPERAREYNGRLLAYGMTMNPYQGCQFRHGVIGGSYRGEIQRYEMYYSLKEESGGSINTGGVTVTVMFGAYGDMASYISYPDRTCNRVLVHDLEDGGWYDIVMKEHDLLDQSFFIDFKNFKFHDLLQGIKDGTYVNSSVKYLGDDYEPELGNRTRYDANKLYQTVSSNFYVYETSLTFDSKIVGLSVNTQALSQGQHGQHPILVFTQKGISAVAVSETGALVRIDPLPRAVALEDKMWQIDNATVFITEKGVNIISGSDIQPLSANMNGRHYAVEESALDVIDRQEGYEAFDDILKDDDAFMTFMKKSEMAYDYAASRLIFFCTDEVYAYMFKMDTQTWHKISLPEGHMFVSLINSYPDALVTMRGEEEVSRVVVDKIPVNQYFIGERNDPYGYNFDAVVAEVRRHSTIIGLKYEDAPSFVLNEIGVDVTDYSILGIEQLQKSSVLAQNGFTKPVYKIIYREEERIVTGYESSVFDYTTFLDDVDDGSSVKAVIATRPFDLGEPDVLKTINHLKIRGMYERFKEGKDGTKTPKVSYILLGSQDGIKYHRLGSLRGKSWKLFRIIILADLNKYERISWIDVEYETRFTNKLR